jgi:hypothetical protein
VPHGLPHRARTGIAAGLTLAFCVLAGSPAQADQTRNNEWWLRALHVTNAWQITRGSGVTIAVLDTGVDPAQPDLTGSVTTGPDYTNSGRTAGGQFWGIHGTEIASLIAGHGHGAEQADGIIGIAPAAKILSVRVTLESNDPMRTDQAIAGALPDAIARGIRWAVRHEATVIALPLDPVTTAGAAGSGGSDAERAAVGYALAKHVVLVAPAGDEVAGTNAVNYPAAYRGVIAVGAFDQNFVKAPFSSHQPYVTVTAAGSGVTTANPSILSASDPSKAYTQLNSTSAASAIVGGIVALIRAQFPDLTPAQVTRALTTGTVYRHGGRSDGSGFGTVDATKALTAAARIAATVSKTATSGAAQSPPSQPAVHSNPIHRNISKQLIMDAVISGVVFLLLLGSILAVRAWRRRHARSARLAEVRAATQVPARKPGTAKKGTAKKGPGRKGPGKKGPAKKGAGKGAPASPQVPAVGGSQAADADAAPEPQPSGFVPAPLSPATPGPGSPTFAGSAPTGFTGSSSFTRSSGFAGSSSPGFAGSASPGFTGSSGFTGSALSGFAGSASSGVAGSASSGFAAAPTPPGSAAAPTPPAPGASAGTGSPGTPGASPADAAPPASLAVPVDPAPSASLESLAAAEANTPPWASNPSEPRAPAKDAASAAIPDSAFPAPAVPVADAAGTGTDTAPGAVGQNRLGARRAPSAAHRPALPRNAQVSGRPPWDPAPQPDSELPWAQAPAPPRGGTGSLPKREQTRPAQPSWDALAEDVWPGGPRGAALHPPVSPPADRLPGGLAVGGGGAGAPARGVSPASRPLPAAGLVPPRPDSAARTRPAEERPGHKRNPATGVAPFRAAQPEQAPAADGPGRQSAGTGIFPASTPDNATASKPPYATAGTPGGATASTPDDATASTPDDAAASEPAVPLPRRLSTPPLHPPSPSPPGQSGTDSSLFRRPGQPPFPPAPRPATEPGAAGTWLPNAAGPFPPAPKPATGALAGDAAAAGAGLPDAGKAQPGGPAVTGDRSGTVAAADPAGPGSTFPQPDDPGSAASQAAGPGSAFPRAAQPSTDSSQQASSVPPWGITDSFLAVPPAPAGTAGTGPEPATPGQLSGRAGAGTAEASESTESFAAVDPGAEQTSFPRAHPGDGDESFPASRQRGDADAFRLFPPVRGTANRPPAPPPSDGED